ncbi:tetratricopeptide repeat protein [Beijerinckia indica]|uniref:Tetratricopeptide TPR_2 repeat protein n=1 Tax=Beijerinckia indica subsp. indica (strain ATCC 9039 / DSM 1715 / NCIMB 8712) TaxID=395963 RepID=B2IB47_BEII9|nr:tetratricopeptide repeat protein [Beijerinckia indica]ACB93745.1 Tetratricopeptide TPR_2 repeat protein [Beijerinckia indica subsp. indica ATCC 9039]
MSSARARQPGPDSLSRRTGPFPAPRLWLWSVGTVSALIVLSSCWSLALADPYPFPHPSPLGPDWRMQEDGANPPSYPLNPLQGWPFDQKGAGNSSREGNRARPGRDPAWGDGQLQGRANPRLKPKPKPDPEEALKKALVPPPDPVVQRQKLLAKLFDHLQAASDEEEARGLAQAIEETWLRSTSVTATLLMNRALAAIQAQHYPLAEDILDKTILLRPDWAEARNQRAKVRFLAGNFQGAMTDVDETLKLEPRHFDALTTMGIILEQTGFDSQALTVLRKALALYPHQPAVEAIVKKLTLSVEGRDI